jgi:hypothetical protein
LQPSEFQRAALASGGFCSWMIGVQNESRILRAEVFNTFVENVVENAPIATVSDSAEGLFNSLH